MSRTALYRHFDAAGRLLYVGTSLHAVQRLTEHKAGSPWFGEISSVRIQWLDSRAEALAAELRAIRTEAPAWNKVGRVEPAKAPVKQRAQVNWVVLHIESGMLDGFYCSESGKQNAEGMRDYFAEEAPRDTFAAVQIPVVPWSLPDCMRLRPSNASWATVSSGADPERLRRTRTAVLAAMPGAIAAAFWMEILKHEPMHESNLNGPDL
jgi:hypothetical protein